MPAPKRKRRTFYYNFLCACNRVSAIATLKPVEDLSEDVREYVVKRLDAGEKVVWPENPDEEEIGELEKITRCVHCKRVQLKYIWPGGVPRRR